MKKNNENKTYAASRAYVWTYCEPSEKLSRAAKNPLKAQTPEQAEGVAIHAAIHAAFDNSITLSREAQNVIAASEDAESVIAFCVDAVKRLSESVTGAQLYFESDADYESADIRISARPDCVIYSRTENTLIVIDYKTGFVPVSAAQNEQLAIYAHAFCAKYRLKPAAIRGVIIQPRLSIIDYAEIAYDERFFADLAAELEKREGQYRVGAHCRSCAAITRCKVFREAIYAYYDPAKKDNLAANPAEWAKLIALARPAKKFFDEILDEAKQYLELGGKLPGVGLTKSAGRRAWFRELSPEQIAEKLKLSPDKLYEAPKVKSPAQVEKLKGVDRDALRSVVYQPQNLSVGLVDERNFLTAEDGEEKFIQIAPVLGAIMEKQKAQKKTKK
jgi:hypothetical protein